MAFLAPGACQAGPWSIALTNFLTYAGHISNTIFTASSLLTILLNDPLSWECGHKTLNLATHEAEVG